MTDAVNEDDGCGRGSWRELPDTPHVPLTKINLILLVFQSVTSSFAVNLPGSEDSTDDWSNIHRKHDQLQPTGLFVINAPFYVHFRWMDEWDDPCKLTSMKIISLEWERLQSFSIPLRVCLMSVTEKKSKCIPEKLRNQLWQEQRQWNFKVKKTSIPGYHNSRTSADLQVFRSIGCVWNSLLTRSTELHRINHYLFSQVLCGRRRWNPWDWPPNWRGDDLKEFNQPMDNIPSMNSTGPMELTPPMSNTSKLPNILDRSNLLSVLSDPDTRTCTLEKSPSERKKSIREAQTSWDMQVWAYSLLPCFTVQSVTRKKASSHNGHVFSTSPFIPSTVHPTPLILLYYSYHTRLFTYTRRACTHQ